MKLAITLRVKNAILFINEWLDCYEKLADMILVVDNGSTDGTLEILKSSDKVIEIINTEGFDEGRDNQVLLDLLNKYKPDWVLSVDADEIFEKNVERDYFEKLMRKSKFINHYRFVLFNLYNDRNHYLANGFMLKAMMRGYGRSLYRYQEKLYVPNRKIHVSISGKKSFFIPSIYRIKHVCFLEKEYRLKVYENYIKVDNSDKNKSIWYERDISILRNPEKAHLLKFKENRIYRIRDFIIFNFFYPIKVIKSLFTNENQN